MTWPAGLVYHQRTALLRNVVSFVRASGAKSLLDIGAGSPVMAVPLSRSVEEYHAVEQDAECAEELRRAGLDVTQATFPVRLDRKYDFVLSSHSVPECSLDSYPDFLNAAWAGTHVTGTMLIVTFKGDLGADADLRRELLGETNGPSPECDAIMEHCNNFGWTEVHHVNSFIEAETATAIAEFISPWLSGRQEVRDGFRDRLIYILEAQHRVREGLYILPTRHLFVSCRRTRAWALSLWRALPPS